MVANPGVNAAETGDKEQGQSQHQHKAGKVRQKVGERKRVGRRRSVLGKGMRG